MGAHGAPRDNLYSLYSLYSLYRLMDKPAGKQQTSMCKNSCRGARVSGSEFGTLGAALYSLYNLYSFRRLLGKSASKQHTNTSRVPVDELVCAAISSAP